MLRKYLSKSRRRSSVAGVAASATAAAHGSAAPHEAAPYWRRLVKACEVLDHPAGTRSEEAVASACTVLRDVQCFGCVVPSDQ